MINYRYSGTNILISGTKTDSSGRANIAVLVTFNRSSDGMELARTTTNKYGNYFFELDRVLVPGGHYEMRFFGSFSNLDYQPLGDWELLEVVPEGGELVEDITMSGPPTFQVSEGSGINDIKIDTSGVESSTAIIEITGINILTGKLASVVVFYKRNYETEYQLFESFDVKASETYTTLEFRKSIFLFSKPISTYDFYAMFLGSGGEVATHDGTDIIVEDLGVEFNGINDLEELYEVTHLSCTNSVNNTDPTENGILSSIFAELEWEDITKRNIGYFPVSLRNGYDGSTYNLSYLQAQRVTGYVVYMYVTPTATPPPHEWPAEDSNWYFVGEFEKPNAKVRCPANSFVAFWVGMKWALTKTSIPKRNLIY